MRVVPSRQHRDCGVAALACALDISYEHAQHLLFPSATRRSKKNWNVNIKQMVDAVRASELTVWHSSALVSIFKPQDATAFLEAADFGPVFITKVKLPCHKGTAHWHWVVIKNAAVYDSDHPSSRVIGRYEQAENARFCGYIGVRRRWPDVSNEVTNGQ